MMHDVKNDIIDFCVNYLNISKELDNLKEKELELEGLKIHNRENIDNLIKNTGKSLPLIINLDSYLIVITEDKIYLEKNVI